MSAICDFGDLVNAQKSHGKIVPKLKFGLT